MYLKRNNQLIANRFLYKSSFCSAFRILKRLIKRELHRFDITNFIDIFSSIDIRTICDRCESNYT